MSDGWAGSLMETADNLAAGDEVEDVESVLRHMSGQLEALGAGDSGANPLGHIVVPSEGAALALPSGEATINFKNGRVEHEKLTGTVAEIVDIRELSRSIDEHELSLQNLIFHVDSKASVEVEGSRSQDVYFQNVPIPFRGFEEVTITLPHPAGVAVLASTQRLPISLGAVTATGTRHGEHAEAVTDSFEAVPVAPFSLWDDHGTTHAEAPVHVAQFDHTTITVDNPSANSLDTEIQANESLSSSSGQWRTIASDTIPAGDHSIFSIEERHRFLRTRVKNSTAGNSISAEVDMQMANP